MYWCSSAWKRPVDGEWSARAIEPPWETFAQWWQDSVSLENSEVLVQLSPEGDGYRAQARLASPSARPHDTADPEGVTLRRENTARLSNAATPASHHDHSAGLLLAVEPRSGSPCWTHFNSGSLMFAQAMYQAGDEWADATLRLHIVRAVLAGTITYISNVVRAMDQLTRAGERRPRRRLLVISPLPDQWPSEAEGGNQLGGGRDPQGGPVLRDRGAHSPAASGAALAARRALPGPHVVPGVGPAIAGPAAARRGRGDAARTVRDDRHPRTDNRDRGGHARRVAADPGNAGLSSRRSRVHPRDTRRPAGQHPRGPRQPEGAAMPDLRGQDGREGRADIPRRTGRTAETETLRPRRTRRVPRGRAGPLPTEDGDRNVNRVGPEDAQGKRNFRGHIQYRCPDPDYGINCVFKNAPPSWIEHPGFDALKKCERRAFGMGPEDHSWSKQEALVHRGDGECQGTP